MNIILIIIILLLLFGGGGGYYYGGPMVGSGIGGVLLVVLIVYFLWEDVKPPLVGTRVHGGPLAQDGRQKLAWLKPGLVGQFEFVEWTPDSI